MLCRMCEFTFLMLVLWYIDLWVRDVCIDKLYVEQFNNSSG